MEHAKPLDTDTTKPYLETMMTVLEESIARQRSAQATEHATSTHLADFRRAFFETVLTLNQLLDDLGGMPIAYLDTQTNIVTRTTVFAYLGYDHLSDTWTVVATDHGQPPTPFMPVREVTLTTPELRTSFEQARSPEIIPPGSVPPL